METGRGYAPTRGADVAGSEIAKAIRGHEPDITITVPTTRVVQGGLPDPIREVVR